MVGLKHDFCRPVDPEIAHKLGLTFAQLTADSFLAPPGPTTKDNSPIWKTPTKKELRAFGMRCVLCKGPAPCAHIPNIDYQINRVNGKLRQVSQKPKQKKLMRNFIKAAVKREKNRATHSCQKTHKITLVQRREEQLRHPTKAGNRFAKLCRMAFPHRKLLREEIKGFYIMDFYFPAINLCVEIDGKIHARPEQKKHDDKRTDYLTREHGVRVLRFSNRQVLYEQELVLQVLTAVLTDKQRKPSDPGNHDLYRSVCPGGPGGVRPSTAVLSC